MIRPTVFSVFCLAVLVSCSQFVLGRDTDFGYPPTISLEQVRATIDEATPEHPRLLVSRNQLAELRDALQSDPLRKGLAEVVIQQANALQTLKPVTRKLEGRRLLGVSRTCLQRVSTLAMAFHLTGDPKHVARCKQEMLAAAEFRDWNPSHFLDVAEMTFALALGYDWLYHELDTTSRERIRAAIVQKALVLPWATRHKGWVRARNNWGQVCHGGLTAGALAVLEDEPDLAARTVHSALHHVTYAMAAYAPNGSYPEGPGYWAYGTSYNVVLIAILESVLGTDFGLTQAPGFSETGQYPSLLCGPSGLFFNYADGGSSRGLMPALYWFASRFDRPDWMHGEADRFKRLFDQVKSSRRAASSRGRMLPFALLWLPNQWKEGPIRMPLHWQSGGETPVTVHRSSWDPNGTFIGLKAGSPSANHGQMDIGSFVLDSDGKRWGMDLGAEGYHGIESRGMNLWSRSQNSDRWTIFRQSNEGHNTLVIDQQLQRANGHAKVISFSDELEFPCSAIDMSSVYKGQAESVRRGVALLPSREVVIQDHLAGLQDGAHVRWGMITPSKATVLDGDTVQLQQGEATMTLRILAPEKTQWQIIDTAKPRHEWDSPNRGTCMVAFEVKAAKPGELGLIVLATPGSCSKSVGSELPRLPLD